MQSWAQSKQQPGQFTGSTGAQIMSKAELSAGHQAWAKKVLFPLLLLLTFSVSSIWESSKRKKNEFLPILK